MYMLPHDVSILQQHNSVKTVRHIFIVSKYRASTKCVSVSMLLPKLSAYPGETFKVRINAFDELERPTAAVLRLSERDVSGDNNL